MSLMSAMTTDSSDRCRRAASCLLLVTLVHLSFAVAASSQESQQREQAQQHVRVPTSHANVHMGPTTARPVLVLVPKDTVLPVVGRQGEWLEVELSPKLKETGMVMRWYENEDRGWMHESTVELVDEEESP